MEELEREVRRLVGGTKERSESRFFKESEGVEGIERESYCNGNSDVENLL